MTYPIPKSKHLKKLVFLLLLVISVKSIDAQVCSDPLNIFYGLDQKGHIKPINVNDASVGSSLNSSEDGGYPGSTTNSNAIGLNIKNGTFYYFQKNTQGSQKFVSYNPATATYTTFVNSPISGSVVKGCVSADGTGYYCIDASGILCYYNIAGNSWSTISSNLIDQFNNSLNSTLTSLGSGDIAVDGLGNLWIVVSSATKWGLYKLTAPLPTIPTASVTLTEKIAPTQSTPKGSPFGGIAYNATGQIYLSTTDDLYLLHDDLSISHEGSFSSSGIGADLTSCNYPFSVLPLSFISFNVSPGPNNSVLLAWSVSQQENDEGFNIEHSSNGQHWNNIGYLTNKQVAGPTAYDFTDLNPLPGINYYRIQQPGLDGRNSYSQIKTINISATGKVSIWPMPARNNIYIETPKNANSNTGNLWIFNLSGKKVVDDLLHGGINTIDISSLSAGCYIVHVILSGGEVIKRQLIKL